MTDILRVEGLSKRYGGVVVADTVDLSIATGTCLGVIGPNGAGKTSLFNLLDGSVRADAGRIVLDGSDVTRVSRHRRARLGIARAFQIPQPFPDLTVFENVLTTATFGAGLAGAAAARAALETLERTGLAAQRHLLAGSLRLLDRKRLELARALATRPRLLLLDEVAGGLTEHECATLIALIKDVRRTGVSIVWIEHIVHALVSAVDRLVVLHGGRFIAEGDPASVIRSPQVEEIYMGIAADA